jgi:predicted CXXCH cytochrome family protein
MRTRHAPWAILLAGPSLVLLFFAIGGCDLREVVEVERPFFKDPPAAALGFLGYDDRDEKLTVCGNCHVGQQAEWAFTAHGGAWVTLAESGHAQAFCESCHTVSANGNPIAEDAGWTPTRDERYHDVQCESCHGPGQVHANNPDVDTAHPIASLAVGDIAADVANATGCAQCHQGAHHPFADEWAQSAHATVVEVAAGREACQGCHRGQGVLAAWGVTDNYVERDAPEHLAITCGVCHDPHSGEHEGQLRRPVATVSVEQHLCASCHDRRTVPDPNSSHGLEPHSPQTALLVGDAGWFPPNATIDQGEIVATHGSEQNPKLCATCHVNRFEVTDEDTGDFVFNATGHLFTSVPCVDASGVPNAGDCGYTVAERSFAACAASGCHASENAAANALTSTAARIRDLAGDLFAVLSLVDPNIEEAGGEIDPTDPIFTIAEGALFNYHLATFGGDVYGSTTHNPFLVESLLIASMDAVLDEYGDSAIPRVGEDLDRRLQEVLDRMPPQGSVRPLVRTVVP